MSEKGVDLQVIKEQMTTQLSDVQVKKSLLATTFKGLDELNMRKAVFEGMMRGFTIKDFLDKNIYAVKFGQGYALVNSVDYNRKIGMRNGVVGVNEPVFETDLDEDGKEKIVSCSVTIKRLVPNSGGVIGDFTAKVYFDEYYRPGNTWNQKYTPSNWDLKPRTMIAKVAEMHALRKACPEDLSQMYIEEEFAAGQEGTNRVAEAMNTRQDMEMGALQVDDDQNEQDTNQEDIQEHPDEDEQVPPDYEDQDAPVANSGAKQGAKK